MLLDGLDEAADRVQRDALSLLAENVSRVFDGCRFVVTSRPPAYTGNTVLPQFVHVEIAPLSDDAVDTFLSHWCRKLYDSVITWLSRSREDLPRREKPERTVTLLQELALAMQDHSDGRQTQVSKRWAAEQLGSGIVVALGNDLRFWHRQFQEFLTARAIAGRPEAEQRTILSGSPPAHSA